MILLFFLFLFLSSFQVFCQTVDYSNQLSELSTKLTSVNTNAGEISRKASVLSTKMQSLQSAADAQNDNLEQTNGKLDDIKSRLQSMAEQNEQILETQQATNVALTGSAPHMSGNESNPNYPTYNDHSTLSAGNEVVNPDKENASGSTSGYVKTFAWQWNKLKQSLYALFGFTENNGFVGDYDGLPTIGRIPNNHSSEVGAVEIPLIPNFTVSHGAPTYTMQTVSFEPFKLFRRHTQTGYLSQLSDKLKVCANVISTMLILAFLLMQFRKMLVR